MLCKPYVRRPRRAVATSYTPAELAALYNFPTGITGPDVTIAIIELDGGYHPSDVWAAFKKWALPLPSLTDINVQGAGNSPGNDADLEVLLDIQIAAAIYSYCTGRAAKIRTYFAPNTNAGFAAAVAQAAADGCVVCSISWGAEEPDWGAAAAQSFDAVCARARAAGMVIFVASGDNLSSDGDPDGKPHVDFPGSSPNVVSCGGTSTPPGGAPTVWNSNGGGTGGGFSVFFGRPAWQVGAPAGGGRMEPDLAANGDPATGWECYANGAFTVVGGTSCVSPCMAGLVAAIASANGGKLPDVLPILYQHTAAFTDVSIGNNGQYRATTGIDPCTGLGVPDGKKLMAAILGPGLSPPPPPPPPPPPGGGGGGGSNPPPGGPTVINVPKLPVFLIGTHLQIGETAPFTINLNPAPAPKEDGGGLAILAATHPHVHALATGNWSLPIPPEIKATLLKIAETEALVVETVVKADLLPLLLGRKTWQDVLSDVIAAVGGSVGGLIGG